jgi:hypothetical protein
MEAGKTTSTILLFSNKKTTTGNLFVICDLWFMVWDL